MQTDDTVIEPAAAVTAETGAKQWSEAEWAVRKDLAAAYRSPEFKAVVDSQFPGYAKPAFLK